MRGYSTRDKFIYWIFQDRIPVTKLIIIANVLTFLVLSLASRLQAPLTYFIGLNTATVLSMPWTLLTYPFLGADGILGMLFQGYWMWVAGGSLERAWGSAKFASFFFTMCLLSALGVTLGGFLMGANVPLAGLWLPIAGVTVAFAMMNPEQQILFFFIIPLKLKYLAVLDAVFVLISYGQSSIILGVLALAGCAFSYWYVVRPSRYRAPRSSAEVVSVYRRSSFFAKINPFAWLKERRDRKRLKNLFRNSGMED